jgi:serine/threonine-protein kinase
LPEQISSYRLEEQIAQGGMGIVYRGVHTVFDEVVAIKAIFPELTLNPELRERFLNEAKIQRRLQHPNIVQIREFLIDQGRFYIVMEFIEGETLAHRLHQLGRPMLASEAMDIFRQALEGLGFAHAQGVIHRDIKPSNIMLTREGVAKLTDFGIARALGSAKLTRTGTALGTPAYMSPEQIQGTKIDQRTDIYSMGITLYEMLTGRVPFERPKDSDSDFPVLVAHINQPVTRPSHWVPEIPPFVESAILKSVEKPPENRFASCQELQVALVPPELPPTKIVTAPRPEPEASARPRVQEPPPEPKPPEPRPLPAPPTPPHKELQPHREPDRAHKQPAGPQFQTLKEEKRPWVMVASVFALLIVGLFIWRYARNQPPQPNPPVPVPKVEHAATVNKPEGQISVPGPPPAENVQPAKPQPVGRREKPTPATDTAAIRKKVNAAITEGDYYYDNGEYDRAIASYQRGLDADPGNAQLAQKIAKARKAKATETSVPQ